MAPCLPPEPPPPSTPMCTSAASGIPSGARGWSAQHATEQSRTWDSNSEGDKQAFKSRKAAAALAE